jgi:hypothetical protein
MSTYVNLYPFQTKNAIKAALASDEAYAISCFLRLYAAQTETEVARRDAIERNRVGFMASHAKRGSRIAEALIAGGEVSVEDRTWALTAVQVYSRQLALLFREEAMEKNPDLRAQAKVFGV